MCEDRRVPYCLANIIFDTFKKLMPTLDRPITRNEHVERYELSRSSLTCPQCVKLHPRLLVALENLPHRNPILNGQCSIHEPADGSSNDFDTRPNDVGSYGEGYDWIESLPSRQCDHAHASDHTDGGPHVREEMMSISFEGYRVSFATNAQQQDRYSKVHQ